MKRNVINNVYIGQLIDYLSGYHDDSIVEFYNGDQKLYFGRVKQRGKNIVIVELHEEDNDSAL